MKTKFLLIFISAFSLMADTFKFPAATTKVTVGSDGSVWLGTTHGLYQFKSGRWTHLTEAAHGRPLGEITALAEEPVTKTLWVGKAGTYGQGIERRVGRKWLSERLSTANRKLPGNLIGAICPNLDGMLVGTQKDLGGIGGAVVFDHQQDASDTFWQGVSISSCFCTQKYCWVGSTHSGLTGFEHGLATPIKSLKGNEWKGMAWIGDYWGAFDNRYIQAIAEDPKERLWIGLKASYGSQIGGLVLHDLRTDHTTHMNLPDDNDVRALVLDSQGYLWIGTRAGLIRFDPDNSKVLSRDTSYGTIHDLFYDAPHKTLWIAHGNQLSSSSMGIPKR